MLLEHYDLIDYYYCCRYCCCHLIRNYNAYDVGHRTSLSCFMCISKLQKPIEFVLYSFQNKYSINNNLIYHLVS